MEPPLPCQVLCKEMAEDGTKVWLRGGRSLSFGGCAWSLEDGRLVIWRFDSVEATIKEAEATTVRGPKRVRGQLPGPVSEGPAPRRGRRP